MNKKTVTFENIGKNFGSVCILKDFNLEVKQGEFLVLLGESGSGKSTALRILAGLEHASNGRIFIGEKEISNLAPKDRNVAMVFQNYALYPHMTVAENIAYPLKVHGVPKKDIKSTIDYVAGQVQLEVLLNRYPSELSGGQRQRVALARAMVRKPDVFLMDEPLSNLDAKLRSHMRTELKHLQKTLGTTTIYVTHDQIEAMTLAHRIAILNNGVLEQLDTPKNIYNKPINKFVAEFIGSPPMNIVNGDCENDHFIFDTIKIKIPDIINCKKLSIGFRPEDCRVINNLSECSDSEISFMANIYGEESMGDHKLIAYILIDKKIYIKLDKIKNVSVESLIAVNLNKIYWFDSISGLTVRQADD